METNPQAVDVSGKSKKTTMGHVLFHLGAAITVTAWGASFVSSKVLLDHGLGPVEIYVYRFILAYVLLAIISHKRFRSNSWKDEVLFLLCGLCAGSIYFIAENMALEYTLVTNVSLITSMSPLLTTLLVGALYRSERPSKGVIVGSLVAFLGVGCVIFNSSFVVKMNPLGDLLSLASALSWSVYCLILRRLQAVYDVMFISRKTFFYGVLTALPFLFAQSGELHYGELTNMAVLGNLLFLGLIGSVFGFIIWAVAVKKLGAVKASNYLYFQPVVTLFASALFLHETITIVGIIGCVLIIGGVWLGDKLDMWARGKNPATANSTR